jgi:hypothetical protein
VGLPFVALILSVWAAVHRTLFDRPKRGPAPLRPALSLRMHPWLLLLSLATAGIAVATMLYGRFEYLFAAGVWLYFYLSLAAERIQARKESHAESEDLPQGA